MKTRLEGFVDIIIGILVKVGCCVGAALGIAGALWGYSSAEHMGLISSLNDEYDLVAGFIGLLGGVSGFIVGGVATSWFIVRLLNRK